MGSESQQTCFVVMGYGKKCDYRSGKRRQLDLDKTYENIIRPTVIDAGLECIRSNELIDTPIIDSRIYEHLLEADVVVADLSTSNANALYELGVRHALRPHATIIMAEKQFEVPFDLNHLDIIKYEHPGPDIFASEARKVQAELLARLRHVIEQRQTDSPVFVFVPRLSSAAILRKPLQKLSTASRPADNVSTLLAQFDEAKRKVQNPVDWLPAIEILKDLQRLQPSDTYITQQLARATYLSREPDPIHSLMTAMDILQTIQPDTSIDPQTIAISGTIHRKLWDLTGNTEHLDKAIRAHARGFFVNNDHNNGISFALLLDVRARLGLDEDAVADRIVARRIRGEVLTICNGLLTSVGARDQATDVAAIDIRRFWIKAAKLQALVGLERIDEAVAFRKEVFDEPAAVRWRRSELQERLQKLVELLEPERETSRRSQLLTVLGST